MMKAANLYLDKDDTLYTFRFVFVTTDGNTSVVRDISQQLELEYADEKDVAKALRLFADRICKENIKDRAFVDGRPSVTADEFRGLLWPKIVRKDKIFMWNGVELSRLSPEEKKAALSWLEVGLACGAIHEPDLYIAEIRRLLRVEDEFDLAAKEIDLMASGTIYDETKQRTDKVAEYLRAKFVPKDRI